MPLTKVASSMLASGISGSGGSSGKNYISTYNGNNCNGDFETGAVTGWLPFTVTSISNGLPSGLNDGTGLGAGTVALSLVSSGQIAGAYSMQAAFPATALQGFISNAFTIDTEDQAKVLTFKFYYNVTSGASGGNFSGTSANTFIVAVYAVNGTNTGWLQPAGLYAMTQSSGGSGIATGTFQTYSDTTQYRFAILCATVPSGAINITFDDFSVGPLTAPIGAPVTDWIDRGTMTIGAVTTAPTKGTASVDKVLMRRVGDSAQFLYEYSQTVAGTAGSGTYLFSLPSGMSIDTTKIPITVGGFIRSASYSVGQGNAAFDSGNGVNANVTVYPYSSTQVALFVSSSQNTAGTGGTGVDESISSSNFALNDSVTSYKFSFTVPIAGWSSNVQMSNDTDTRVVAANFGGDAASVGAAAVIVFPTVKYDTHGAYNPSTGIYTVPVSGLYKVTGFVNGSASLMYLSVYKGTSPGTNYSDLAYINAAGTATLAGTVQCVAGDTLSIRPSATYDAASNCSIQIERLSGPSVIAATESVNAKYYKTATQTFSTETKLTGYTKIFDTHNAWDSTNNLYRFPVSGKYLIQIQTHATPATSATQVAGYRLNGGASSLYIGADLSGSAVSRTGGSTLVSANAGDYIEIYLYATASVTVQASEASTNFSITRVGN